MKNSHMHHKQRKFMLEKLNIKMRDKHASEQHFFIIIAGELALWASERISHTKLYNRSPSLLKHGVS